jgi:predicted 3-demethylubiquinone-9 3-methyltransferase (glyoxalase superfamily)
LTGTIAFKCLEPIAWKTSEVRQGLRCIEDFQSFPTLAIETLERPHELALGENLRALVPEAQNHRRETLARWTMYVKRQNRNRRPPQAGNARPTKKSDTCRNLDASFVLRASWFIRTQPTRTSLMTSITPFLWLDNNVPEAVAFYTSVFPNAKVETVNDFMASFELEGQRFNALNGGPRYKFNEAISFFISVETQEEVDYFWSRLTADGGQESRCGWLKDKFGLSWQVVPTALGRYLSDPDRKKADRAMQAMMQMQKIVIADLDKAFAG